MVTARSRRMGEGNIFSLFTPCSRLGGGGVPTVQLMGAGHLPSSQLGWGGDLPTHLPTYHSGVGTPPPARVGVPCPHQQHSKYLLHASGMPLAFMQEDFLVTTCIRRMGEGTVFSLFVSPHLDGRGVSQPGHDGGGCPGHVWMVGGGYASQVWMVGGGIPWPGLDSGGYPSQVWMVGEGTQPGLDGGGYLEYPPP